MATLERWQEVANTLANKFFNTPEDQDALKKVAEHYSIVYSEKYTNPRYKLFVTKDASYAYAYETGSEVGSPRFSLSIVAEHGRREGVTIQSHVARLTLQPYPHCCAMNQLNGFEYSDLTEDQVDHFMNLCIAVYCDVYDHPYRRWILNMVEVDRVAAGLQRHDLVEEIPHIDEPMMSYPHIYTWAMKQERVQDTLMRNPNTGRVIHHMEVIVNNA